MKIEQLPVKIRVLAVYRGYRYPMGCDVTTQHAWPTDVVRQLDLRLDLYSHSPTGFEWGYGGSGPAQLALAMLADFYGYATGYGGRPDSLAVSHYQQFKERVIANLPNESPPFRGLRKDGLQWHLYGVELTYVDGFALRVMDGNELRELTAEAVKVYGKDVMFGGGAGFAIVCGEL